MADKSNLSIQESVNLYLMIQEKGLDAVIDGTIDVAEDLLKRKKQNIIWMQPDNFVSILEDLKSTQGETQDNEL